MPEYKYVSLNGHKLYNHLGAAPDSNLFHESYSVPFAHPADIFLEKLSPVVDSFIELSSQLKEIKDNADQQRLIRNLVERMNEFYDHLIVIIGCFTSPLENMSGSTQEAIVSFLKREKIPAYKKFNERTKGEHAYIRNMANVFKHKIYSVQPLSLTNHHDKEVNGFIIQVVIGPDDLRGPDRDIHPMYQGLINTGISYNHFLLSIIGRVFSYMECLDNCLFTKTSPSKKSVQPLLNKLICAAENIEYEFFPDEYGRPFAQIKTIREAKIVNFPYKYSLLGKENPDLIKSVQFSSDANHRTLKSNRMIPYLQLINR